MIAGNPFSIFRHFKKTGSVYLDGNVKTPCHDVALSSWACRTIRRILRPSFR